MLLSLLGEESMGELIAHIVEFAPPTLNTDYLFNSASEDNEYCLS